MSAIDSTKRAIIKVFPPGLKRYLRKIQASLRLATLRVFSYNGFFASVYFTLLSRRFYGEHRAVLKGRLQYYENVQCDRGSSWMLRRNTHRIEKGLVMQPRRPVFGERFILETVRAFNKARATISFSPEELKWAGDVLKEYFAAVSNTPVIAAARREFIAAGGGAEQSFEEELSHKSTPYPRAECPETTIAFDELHDLCRRRRSVRWYLDRPVPPELINKVIDAAAQAPSACNRQPFRFIVSTDAESASRIASYAGGTVGFSHQLPAIIAVIGDLSAYPLERDRHLIYIDSALASMQLMLAAETLGLATCPINWPDIASAEQRMRTLLGLPLHERVIMLIAIGYADPEGGVPYSQKKQRGVLVQEYPIA
jgi:nitroreductase